MAGASRARLCEVASSVPHHQVSASGALVESTSCAPLRRRDASRPDPAVKGRTSQDEGARDKKKGFVSMFFRERTANADNAMTEKRPSLAPTSLPHECSCAGGSFIPGERPQLAVII